MCLLKHTKIVYPGKAELGRINGWFLSIMVLKSLPVAQEEGLF